VIGASYDASTTRFNGTPELATIGTNYVVSGSGIFLGQSGDPVSIGPVSLRTTSQYTKNSYQCIDLYPGSNYVRNNEVVVYELDDQVNDVAFDKYGSAWMATRQGVSVIKKRRMTLAEKQHFFYDVQMKRHIREPWISGQCHLNIPGDTTSFQPEDDDNDGEYTGNYLTMESFHYAVTKSPDAKEKAKKAFTFLKQLQTITGSDGFFARTIVPVHWKERVHDGNRNYTVQELADEQVKEPRFKPVETRWHASQDGKWLWKGDASSDEWCGHMMGYYFYYELVADTEEKETVRRHVAKLVDHLIANDFNMMDVDGRHTRWSVWSPDLLNRDPEWKPDQAQNSMELLAFLKLAYYMTGDIKYAASEERILKFIH